MSYPVTFDKIEYFCADNNDLTVTSLYHYQQFVRLFCCYYNYGDSKPVSCKSMLFETCKEIQGCMGKFVVPSYVDQADTSFTWSGDPLATFELKRKNCSEQNASEFRVAIFVACMLLMFTIVAVGLFKITKRQHLPQQAQSPSDSSFRGRRSNSSRATATAIVASPLREPLEHKDNQESAVQRENNHSIDIMNTTHTSTEVALSNCLICDTNPKNIAFSPCGHIAFCESCLEQQKRIDSAARETTHCCICRQKISRTLKIFVQ
jgi:hypothetical protein